MTQTFILQIALTIFEFIAITVTGALTLGSEEPSQKALYKFLFVFFITQGFVAVGLRMLSTYINILT